MAERKKSKDGVRETEELIGDTETPSQQGRAQGNLERKVGTRDDLRQLKEGAVRTRVTKKDEKGRGDLGGHHGTGEDDEHS
ncbi:MAG: hypothetical protein KJO42_15460 [Silicimonas sp.]|nr:hypothetical protein [Silicimonas sp.]MBT8425816.1 hypothetical protein [Silicimonas sp.]NND21503.1 hypothetical protein [Silicimonas sp.]NNL73974.1 hypothetical protein [Silicimonas sp.]